MKLSYRRAAELGIERLRDPKWANPLDHVKIDIVNGRPGPWLHLFCPINIAINGRDPVDVLWVGQPDTDSMVAYDGPLPDSDEYRAASS